MILNSWWITYCWSATFAFLLDFSFLIGWYLMVWSWNFSVKWKDEFFVSITSILPILHLCLLLFLFTIFLGAFQGLQKISAWKKQCFFHYVVCISAVLIVYFGDLCKSCYFVNNRIFGALSFFVRFCSEVCSEIVVDFRVWKL